MASGKNPGIFPEFPGFFLGAGSGKNAAAKIHGSWKIHGSGKFCVELPVP